MSKIIALLAFCNEENYLPGFFAHLRDYVSEFIVLDDNSTDRSAEIARAESNTTLLTVGTREPHPEHFYEVDNRRNILETALARSADWALACDADERYEKRFLESLPILTRKVKCAYALRVRDLWDSKDHYRIDGVWEAKVKFVLFPVLPFTDYYPSHTLHTKWPAPNIPCSDENILDFNLYHLISLRRADRLARLRKFKTIDPESRYQRWLGYDYLADENGLKVAEIPSGREFQMVPEDAHLFA